MTAPTRRPAEAAGATGGVVAVVAAALGADTPVVAALAAAAGALPAIVTFIVTRGGIRGTVRLLWRGPDRP
jgi:hypothetical protein